MPYLKDEVISHFTSNNDIIDCIIASALIPFALNGRVRIVSVSVSVHAITAELVNCWKMRSLCSSALLHHCPLISPSSAYLECIYCMIRASVHSNSYFSRSLLFDSLVFMMNMIYMINMIGDFPE